MVLNVCCEKSFNILFVSHISGNERDKLNFVWFVAIFISKSVVFFKIRLNICELPVKWL